ncbi:MAG: replication-associated recombination protein A [Clostridia bacterium]|nr:replication-associated recombination protein A [Clostridia bacterium]
MDLFDFSNNANINAPLADKMRPSTLDEFIGQEHLIFPGSLLVRAIKADKLGSCIFWGPPGTGKTTLASIIANTTSGAFVKLNAVSSGVADAKKVIEEAKQRLKMYGKKTYLLLDECHRWNKAQSDCVLSAIEDGSIVFIGSTTENPHISMTRAIVSRCRIFELKALTPQSVKKGLKRAITDEKNGFGRLNLTVSEDALDHFVWGASGDLRNALGGLELAVLTTTPNSDGAIIIDKAVAEQSIQKKTVSVDESTYYDMLSAFCKSLRGSSVEGALYWAYRLIESGLDPLIIFRRLIAHASEDVGMANSQALVVAVSALTAYKDMGAPEGIIPLTHAIICVCTSPKSNSVVVARDNAQDAVKTNGDYYVPLHLRNTDFSTADKSEIPYLYPHNFGGYVKQQYLPDSLDGVKFYYPSENGEERAVKEFLEKLERIYNKGV